MDRYINIHCSLPHSGVSHSTTHSCREVFVKQYIGLRVIKIYRGDGGNYFPNWKIAFVANTSVNNFDHIYLGRSAKI